MKKTASAMGSNYIYNLLYRLSICILPLLITPYTARVLGSDGAGLYSFSSCVACYFIMFAKLGLDHYGSRSIACLRDDPKALNHAFCSIYAMQLVTSLCSIAVYVALVLTVFRDEQVIYWMQLLYVLSALFDVSWFFFGTERFKATTIRSLITRALVVVCVFLFVHTADDLWIYTLILSLSFLVEQVILFCLLFRHVHFERVHWSDIRPHIVPNLRLFFPLAVLSIYNWMDKLMVGLLSGNGEVAFYNYAESIINLPKGILLTLGTVMLPHVSRLAATKQHEEAARMLRQSMSFTCCLCCLLCFGIAAVAPVFIPLFLGPGYEATISLTMYLALVMIPLSLTDTLQNQYLVPFKQEKVYTMSVTVGAITNLILNSLLIPIWGGAGAVIGTIGASLGAFLYQMVHVRKIFSFRSLLSSLLPFMLCGTVEFLCAYSLRGISSSPFVVLAVQLLVGGGSYLICCIPVLLFWKKDLYHFLKRFIGK